jgi:hypothetical protein
MRKIWLSVLAFGVLALPGVAQEKEPEAESTARDERPHIQVLKNPYDLASFYRAPGGSSSGFSYSARGRSWAELYSARTESGLPAGWFRRGFSSRFDASLGDDWDEGWRWDARGNRWIFDGSRPGDTRDSRDSRAPRPAPSRP